MLILLSPSSVPIFITVHNSLIPLHASSPLTCPRPGPRTHSHRPRTRHVRRAPTSALSSKTTCPALLLDPTAFSPQRLKVWGGCKTLPPVAPLLQSPHACWSLVSRAHTHFRNQGLRRRTSLFGLPHLAQMLSHSLRVHNSKGKSQEPSQHEL